MWVSWPDVERSGFALARRAHGKGRRSHQKFRLPGQAKVNHNQQGPNSVCLSWRLHGLY